MDQGAFGWRRMLGMQQPQPSMDEMRQRMGGAVTEAELQHMMSGAGPAATGGAFGNPMAGRDLMGGAVTEAELQRMREAQQPQGVGGMAQDLMRRLRGGYQTGGSF